MANNDNDSRSGFEKSPKHDPEQTVLERVQELTWALLDDDISDDELSLLDTLLLTGKSARERYVECVQLHTGLISHFEEPNKKAAQTGSPVLSFLNAGTTLIDVPSPRPVE